MKAVVGAFNQKGALVGAFSVELSCEPSFEALAAAVSTEAEASSQQPELSANARTEVKGQSSAPATNQRWPRPAPTLWPPPTADPLSQETEDSFQSWMDFIDKQAFK